MRVWSTFGSELVLVFSLLGALIRLVIVPETHKAPITTAALTLLGLMYVPFLFNFVALLAFLPGTAEQNRFLLIYLLAVTKFSERGRLCRGLVDREAQDDPADQSRQDMGGASPARS